MKMGRTIRTEGRSSVMRSSCQTRFTLRLAVLLLVAKGILWAEAGVLVVHVEDVQRHPISGVQIGVEGDGGSAITGNDGKARIPLAKGTKEKSWVSLQILKSPPLKDFVMVSPWDYRAVVPSFENESENFVKVVVVHRGDRVALESGTVLSALAAQINKANAPTAQKSYLVGLGETLTTSDSLAVSQASSHSAKEDGEQTSGQQSKAALAVVAASFGMTPDEIDKAIRAWGARTTDPYELGLAALYERNYSEASTQLASSLQQREEKLAADQKAVTDAACFLGQSFYAEGKYRDAATAYQRCLQLQPDDSRTLNNLAVSLADAGDPWAAEPLCRRALAINEKALGPDHPDVALSLNNLGLLLCEEGDFGEGHYAAAEALYRRALSIDEKALGPDHPNVATTLNNLADLLSAKGDDAAAELLDRRALAIREKALGPDHPDVAVSLNNLGLLLWVKGDYAAAEPLYRRALTIDEKALGPNHPTTQQIRYNLASTIPGQKTEK